MKYICEYCGKEFDAPKWQGRKFWLFENKGYKTLIIWEHELKNEKDLLNKIKGFGENYAY